MMVSICMSGTKAVKKLKIVLVTARAVVESLVTACVCNSQLIILSTASVKMDIDLV